MVYVEAVKEKQQHIASYDTSNISVIISYIERCQESKRSREQREKITNQWIYVASVVDRCLLVIFIILNLAFTHVMILRAVLGTDE